MNTKSLFESARNIPIDHVMAQLGSELLERGRSQKYRLADGRKFVVSGYAWFEIGGKAGSGAIDLMMLINGCGSRAALNYLLGISFPISGAGVAPSGATPASRVSGGSKLKIINSEIPDPNPDLWTSVRTWLTQVRSLDAAIIDALYQNGMLFADCFNNAIFVCTTGDACELRGTGSTKFAGRRGRAGVFELPPVNTLSPTAVVESAIDAVSLRMLGHKGRIISTGGGLTSATIDYLKTLKPPFMVAFDSDEAGENYSVRLAEAVPGTYRMRPVKKDWNDVLLLAVLCNSNK